MGGQPSKGPLECRCGVAHVVQALVPLAELVLLGESGRIGTGAVDRGQRRGALGQQVSPAVVVELSLDATHDGLPGDLVADQKRVTKGSNRIRRDQNVGHRRSGGRGSTLDGGLESHTRMHVVGRAGAQDQRPAGRSRDRLERPRGAAGAAG